MRAGGRAGRTLHGVMSELMGRMGRNGLSLVVRRLGRYGA